MEAYAIISIQTASPALDFQCLVFLTDELKTQLLYTGYACYRCHTSFRGKMEEGFEIIGEF